MKRISLFQWIWGFFIRIALVPYIVMGIVFVVSVIVINKWIFHQGLIPDRSVLAVLCLGACLIVLHIIFALTLYRTIKNMTGKLAEALAGIKEMTAAISDGRFIQRPPDLQIRELNDTAIQIVRMGNRLKQTMDRMEGVSNELETARNDLLSIVHSLDDAVLIVDGNGVILNAWSGNPDYFSKPLHEVTGTSIESNQSKQVYEEQIKVLRRVLETGNPEIVEYQAETPQGRRWQAGRVSAITENDGTRRKVSVLSKDITARKEMEASLRQAKEEAESASRAKSDFLSRMSHELRTPMNAILGFAQLLQYDGNNKLSPEQKESVDEILKAGRHLLAQIDDILVLARIESGAVSVHSEYILAAALVDDCLGMIEPMAKEKQVLLHHHISSEWRSFNVYADPMKLKGILLNLLSNSVKYNKQHGQVFIIYEVDGSFMKIHISDTGFGIAPDQLERIFDSFYRVEDYPLNTEGTGIGLSISKQFIELMGGTIEVDSRVGEGSRFTVVIPLDCSVLKRDKVSRTAQPNHQ
jgi:PAS domain S-box-containing protein